MKTTRCSLGFVVIAVGVMLEACGGEKLGGPALAVRLAFTVPPANATAGAAITPPVRVSLEDASGTTVGSATNAVTVALGTKPGGATLAGTTTVNAVNGVATFGNLVLQNSSAGYTLIASSGSLTGVTSAPFAVAPAAPSQLAFVVQPGGNCASCPIVPSVQVAIQDAFGNTVTTATNVVTLALATNPYGGMLSGTAATAAVNGVAVFADLRVASIGTYQIVATSGTLTSATSAWFDIYDGWWEPGWTRQP